MVDVQEEGAATPTAINMMPAKNKELKTDALKRTSDWIFSQEIPSDVTINVAGVSFSLHKFPLVSKCGYIRKLISNLKQTNHKLEILHIPGGSEGFELAAKFCYGINFELSIENISMLRCVAEFLEMTEEYAVGNLISRTEGYLNEIGLKTLAGAVLILQSSERFLTIAENVKIITRCVDAIVFMVMKENQFSLSASADSSSVDGLNSSSSSSNPKDVVGWWVEDLVVLGICNFQRVLLAMISMGFKPCTLGPVLMLYAQKCLQDLEIFRKNKNKKNPNQENEKRVILETIVSLLPREKNTIPFTFLSMLIRAAIYLETTVACRLDLEKRMGLELEQAILDDILIPSFRFNGDTLFDVDIVLRVLMNYLEYEHEDVEKVTKLMERYLAEIALDCNLSVSKFINLVECIPDQEWVIEDGKYRAIDIYLKAHPVLSDTERKKLCSLINCQNLTSEACAHAAQNDRLSEQTAVQVLYHEQKRLKESITYGPRLNPIPDNQSSLQKENQDLKFELSKVKTRLKEINKSDPDKSLLRRRSFMSSVSKKLGKLTPFLWVDHGVSPLVTKNTNKSRRHSIS